MAAPSLFPDCLRAEYDIRVLDATARALKAKQLRRAFEEANLWKPPTKILDVGSGSGLLLAALNVPHAQRIGCDVRLAAFQSSGLNHDEIQFVQADAATLPFRRGEFDLVICLAVAEEFPDWRAVMQTMANCVAHGGILYVTITNGQILVPVYTLLETLGRRVSEGAWRYAKSSLRFADRCAKEGFGIDAMCGWRYLDVTPYLARARFPVLHALPTPSLKWLMRYTATSFGHAWQRPFAS